MTNSNLIQNDLFPKREPNNTSALESDLWQAADDLRANSKLTSSEYCMPVLGIIFLRHAYNRYETALQHIEKDQAEGKIAKRPLVKADFVSRRAMMLPPNAQYPELLNLAQNGNLGKALVDAMSAIEKGFPPLENQLPKDYEKFESSVLENLLRIFDSDALRKASGDLFGRIYEYFLMKFAIQGAQDNGEFFTPPSIVQMIVNVIEPDHGIVLDPACGSGGMFVQSSHFIERQGLDSAHRLTFYGQEKTSTTIRLAKMNLAVHGLEGDIREANTFYDDVHELYGRCDFVMANPPFNVDMVDAEKVKTDRRLPFGLPGVNGDKKVSNGNYLWISYFHSYLNEQGRAGFVMSSQASSAGNKEAEVRRRIVETGSVDVMISIRSNFFYTRSVPCELWHFDKGKPQDRRDCVLMIDARSVYRKIDRRIYDFTPEQLKNLSAIVWLYRGQSGRFCALVQEYLNRVIQQAAALPEKTAPFSAAYQAMVGAAAPFLKTLPADSPLLEMAKERDQAGAHCLEILEHWIARAETEWRSPCPAEITAQQTFYQSLAPLAQACHDLVKQIDLVSKLSNRLVESAEKEHGARAQDAWKNRVIARLKNDLEPRRKEAVEALKALSYFHRQAHWLLSRFPEARFVEVPGLCKVVTLADIQAADWSLTPGRYVGVTPTEVDEEFDFEQTLRDIHLELSGLNTEAILLAQQIQENFKDLGI